MVFLKAPSEDWEEGPLHVAIRRSAAGSGTTYGSPLRRFLDGRDGAKGPLTAALGRKDPEGTPQLGDWCLQSVCFKRFTSSHPLTCTDTGCTLRGSVESLPSMPPRVFAETADLLHLGKSRD